MASRLNQDTNTLKEENKNSKMYKDVIKTIHSTLEIALLLKRNKFDQNILDKSENK